VEDANLQDGHRLPVAFNAKYDGQRCDEHDAAPPRAGFAFMEWIGAQALIYLPGRGGDGLSQGGISPKPRLRQSV